MYRVYQIKKIQTSLGKKPSMRASKSSIKAILMALRKALKRTMNMAGASIEIEATKMLARDMQIGMLTSIDR